MGAASPLPSSPGAPPPALGPPVPLPARPPLPLPHKDAGRRVVGDAGQRGRLEMGLGEGADGARRGPRTGGRDRRGRLRSAPAPAPRRETTSASGRAFAAARRRRGGVRATARLRLRDAGLREKEDKDKGTSVISHAKLMKKNDKCITKLQMSRESSDLTFVASFYRSQRFECQNCEAVSFKCQQRKFLLNLY